MYTETIKTAQSCRRWWWFYYHLLVYLHIALGVSGVVLGAVIAAGAGLKLSEETMSMLGVISAVIVGIVSFLQPGRMASVFYDAYWRMRMAILSAQGSPTAKEDLIAVMTDGYTRLAAIQPEALRKAAANTLDVSKLSEERRAALTEKLEELLAEENAAVEQAISEQAAGGSKAD